MRDEYMHDRASQRITDLQIQLKAEKERADKAEENYAKLRSEHIKLMGDAGEYLEREQKLREALDKVIPYVPQNVRETYDFDSLYPEEGEA